jgi:hypothetical protein
VDVTLRAAGLTKTIRVVGDRVWKPGVLGLAMTEPEPFVQMPITYERAFGGADRMSDNPRKHDWDRRNPVGTGFAVDLEHLIGQKLPNIEDPSNLIGSWRSRPRPPGFGPIARYWLPRAELAGTYDDKWEKTRFPLLPDDFDERFYLSAPADQQSPNYLKGGETVELLNLTPAGLLRFELPREVFGFRTYFLDGEPVHHRAKLHAVILEPDLARVLMVWQTALACHPKVLKLQKTTIVRKKRLSPVSKRFSTPAEDRMRARLRWIS